MSLVVIHRLIAGLCLLACSVSAGGGERATQTVQSLGYGVTLYHFYQQDYFAALTELMVAQKTDALGVHSEHAELLRGGMSLSYGMDTQAQQIFTELLSQPRPGVDGDSAWFYLGKMAWQRGDVARAETALQHVNALPSPQLQQEFDYLQTTLNVRQGNIPAAQQYLARLPADSPWLPYHYYNMGALHAARGEWAEAAGYFGTMNRLELAGEEALSLRDRAYTAAGFAAMAAGDYPRASSDFARVRLSSPMSERALLGYGWAAGAQDDYQSALSPWQTLNQQAAVSQAVRESLLAVPYAYEQLGQQGVALVNYQHAAQAFEDELQAVNRAIAAFSRDDLQDLLGLRGDQRDNWLFGGDILPRNLQTPYLRQLISSHAFQMAMRELRDLHRMEQRLAQAAQRLQVMTIVDREQQQSWTELIEQDRASALQQRRTQLQMQIESLQHKLSGAEADGDGRALASASQIALWQRFDQATALSKKMDTSPEQQFRLELYRGLLVWEDAEHYAQNLWQNRQALQQLAELALLSEQAIERLRETQAQRVSSSFAGDIAALDSRLATQNGRLQLAISASGQALRQVAVSELQQQEQALSLSLGQSRLAIARLYDLGSMGGAP